jgi:hypothetical protein
MEILGKIQMWIYPVMSLFIFVFSAVKFRNNGSVFFIFAFGLNFLSALLWRALPLTLDFFMIPSVEVYKYYGIISFVLYLFSSVFFIVGIALLGNTKQEKRFGKL